MEGVARVRDRRGVVDQFGHPGPAKVPVVVVTPRTGTRIPVPPPRAEIEVISVGRPWRMAPLEPVAVAFVKAGSGRCVGNHAVPAGLLGAVHGRIGAGEEGGEIRIVGPHLRDTEADGDAQAGHHVVEVEIFDT